MHRVLTPFLVLVFVGTGVSVAAPFGRATTFGSTLLAWPTGPPAWCAPPEVDPPVERCVVAQPDPSPIAGVLTAVKFKTADAGNASIRVMRPAGDDYELVGSHREPVSSPAVMFVRYRAGENTVATRIPIAAGDRVGLEDSAALIVRVLTATPGFVTPLIELTRNLDGSPALAYANVTGGEPLIQGVVEADIDGDGFGDETQDQCPTHAEHQLPCSRLVVETTAARTVVLPGAPATFTTTVTNVGPAPAPQVQIQLITSAPVTSGVQVPGKRCTSGATPTCNVGPLAAGQSDTFVSRVEGIATALLASGAILPPASTPATWVLLPGPAATAATVTTPLGSQVKPRVRVLSQTKRMAEVSCLSVTPDACSTVAVIVASDTDKRLSRIVRITIPSGQRAVLTIPLLDATRQFLRKRRSVPARVRVTRLGEESRTSWIVDRPMRLTGLRR